MVQNLKGVHFSVLHHQTSHPCVGNIFDLDPMLDLDGRLCNEIKKIDLNSLYSILALGQIHSDGPGIVLFCIIYTCLKI